MIAKCWVWMILPERFQLQKQAARKLNKSLPTDSEMEAIPLEDLGEHVSDVGSEIRRDSVNLDGVFPMRELLGLDEALQRIQGELANNVAKLTEIDKRINIERDKRKEMANDPIYTDEQRKEVENRVKKLQDERSTRLELASHNKKALQSQFARIRQTIEKVLDSDTSLAERIKTLFREQGITIASILTAFGFLISTIVGFVTGGGGGTTVGKPPSKGGGKEWMKKQLKALARLFGKLAQQLGAALPGIIGSILSWLFTLLKKATLFMAEYIYLAIAAVAGLMVAWMMQKKV